MYTSKTCKRTEYRELETTFVLFVIFPYCLWKKEAELFAHCSKLVTFYFLLVARYFLLFACYILLVASYFLFVANYFRLVAGYFLLVAGYFLLVV